MPAKKPLTLITRHDSASSRADRSAAEGALSPRTPLREGTPAALRGHAYASRTWTRLVKLYREMESPIATVLDQNLLVRYCLLEEEIRELMLLRKQIRTEWQSQLKHAKKIQCNSDNLKDWVRMWDAVNAIFSRFQGMDARLDGKRKLLVTIEQSLYLTPRSRAGVTPPEKPAQTEPDEIEQLLSESE